MVTDRPRNTEREMTIFILAFGNERRSGDDMLHDICLLKKKDGKVKVIMAYIWEKFGQRICMSIQFE